MGRSSFVPCQCLSSHYPQDSQIDLRETSASIRPHRRAVAFVNDDDRSGARNAALLTPQTLVLAAAVSRRGRDELQTVHMSSILSISCCEFQSILGEPLVWLA